MAQDLSNHQIINAARNTIGGDFFSRVTEATQANVRETAAEIMDYRPNRNAFIDALVNVVGSHIAREMSWSNPLAEFKRGMLSFGDTIEETKVGLPKAKSYSADRDYLEKDIFGVEKPYAETNWHRTNREEYYKITVHPNELRKAFLSDGGLNALVNQLMQAPITADNWDEFLLMCSLFPQYEANGGFYRVNVPDARSIDVDSHDAKQTMKKVRAMAEELTFMSTKYNAAGMQSAANRDDLVLFTTPQFNATMDVDVLAASFNMERTTLAGRQISVPQDQFGLDGAQAILTTRDFFVVADTTLENTNAPNPVGLTHNYFMHHHSIISQSRFAPAVLFHTGQDDGQVVELTPANGISTITLENREGGTVTGAQDRGTILVAKAKATYDGEGEPDQTAVYWTLTGNNDPTTRITQHGTVHIGGREDSTNLQIQATAVFIDPESPNTETYRAVKNISINKESPVEPQWPNTRPAGPTDYEVEEPPTEEPPVDEPEQ